MDLSWTPVPNLSPLSQPGDTGANALPFKSPPSPHPRSPFDDFSLPTGGVVLKCSDGAKFKVYKNILSLSSTFFLDMFTLPQPAEADRDSERGKETSEIEVTENAQTIDVLLRLIYPVAPATFPGQDILGVITMPEVFISSAEAVLTTAIKYDMPVVVRYLCTKLVEAAEDVLPNGTVANETLALRVFILACKHGLKKEAKAAAHAVLRAPLANVFITELREISAAQYFHLRQFHSKIAKTIESMLKPGGLPQQYESLTESNCNCRRQISKPGSVKYYSAWWYHFMDNYLLTLVDAPLSGVPFFSQSVEAMMTNTCHSCRASANANWPTVSEYVKSKIILTISEVILLCMNELHGLTPFRMI